MSAVSFFDLEFRAVLLGLTIEVVPEGDETFGPYMLVYDTPRQDGHGYSAHYDGMSIELLHIALDQIEAEFDVSSNQGEHPWKT